MEALGKIGDSDAVGLLINILLKGGPERWYAATALGELGDKRAVSHLIWTLQNARGGSDLLFLKSRAAWALGEIGDLSAIPVLVVELASCLCEAVNPCDVVGALDKLGQPQWKDCLSESGKHVGHKEFADLIKNYDDSNAVAEVLRFCGKEGITTFGTDGGVHYRVGGVLFLQEMTTHADKSMSELARSEFAKLQPELERIQLEHGNPPR